MSRAEPHAICDNCGQRWPISELHAADRLHARLDPGSIVPDGQCPDDECGALCYEEASPLRRRVERLAQSPDDLAVLERLLKRGRRELDPDNGSNDGEHDVLVELIDLLTPPEGGA